MHVVIFWKIENISVKIRTLCLCYRREIGACLKDYFSKIYRLQKCSQSCPNMPQSYPDSVKPAALWPAQIFLCGWENNPLGILYAQRPENPLRKCTNIQDIPDGKKTILGVGISVGGLLSSQTFPLLTERTVGCSPAPRARSSSWNTAFGFSVRGERPVMI